MVIYRGLPFTKSNRLDFFFAQQPSETTEPRHKLAGDLVV